VKWRPLFTQMRRLVAEVEPDVIHSHFLTTTLTARLALGRSSSVPRIFQVPGPLHLEYAAVRRAELATAGPADHWIGSCRWTCDAYRASGVADDRVFLSHYGSELSSFSSGRPGILRAELGVGAGVKLVGTVAFMYPPKRYLGQRRGIKGHEDLIDAVARCRRTHPGIEAVFVGGEWGGGVSYEEKVRRYGAARLGGAAHFLGTRTDALALYPDLDVVVHPSHSENLGGAAESLLLGRPTVATDVGGFPDLVTPGQTGWLVPPHDPVRLASAIGDVLDHPDEARARAARGRDRARALLDVRVTAAQVRAIYEGVTARPAPGRGSLRR